MGSPELCAATSVKELGVITTRSCRGRWCVKQRCAQVGIALMILPKVLFLSISLRFIRHAENVTVQEGGKHICSKSNVPGVSLSKTSKSKCASFGSEATGSLEVI